MPAVKHRLRQMYRRVNINIRYMLVLVLLVVVWMLSGIIFNTQPPETHTPAAQNTHQNSTATVTVLPVQAQDYTETVVLYGSTDAKTKATVAARTAGTVEALFVNVGDMVQLGAPLLKIDIGTRMAQLQASKATFAQAKTVYEAGKQLHAEGFLANTALAEREAAFETAREAMLAAEKEIAYTKAHSPVSGRVEARMVSVGDLVSVGTPLFTVVGQQTYLLVGYAAQKDQQKIAVGKPVQATLANGQKVDGVVTFVARLGDEQTRTYRVEAEVDGTKHPIPTGMSATLYVPVSNTQAHLVPHAALVLNDNGKMGVRYVENGTVAFKEVSNFNADNQSGVWVVGLPTTAQVIVRGQNAVKSGDKVTAVVEETKPESTPSPAQNTPQNQQ